MRVRTPLLLCALAIGGCQDKKTELAPSVAGRPENLPPRPEPRKSEPAGPELKEAVTPQPKVKKTEPARPEPTGPVAGAIKGKPFKPDTVWLTGNKLEFRLGTAKSTEAGIRLDLPESPGGKWEGKSWAFDHQFGGPVLTVSWGPDWRDGLYVLGNRYRLSIRIAKQTKQTVEGTIDLKLDDPPDTHLAGVFTAEVRKTPSDPLAAEDAPFVRGEIKFVGTHSDKRIWAGFVGVGADGKEQSNSVLMSLDANGDSTLGPTVAQELGSQLSVLLTPEKGQFEYRHTHLAPGDYLVHVRRGEELAAWKRLTVKAGDQLTADLTLDATAVGEVVVTLPDVESKARLRLIPADAPRVALPFFVRSVTVSGEPTVTVKNVPAGKYRAVRGESEADVEVVAGKSAAVTLVRPKK
jgi:hypothetical protein